MSNELSPEQFGAPVTARSAPASESEIIELGAIVLHSRQLQTIEEFQTLVKER
ncbi:hypothetical protein GCM10022278_37810 [Allohahella marinimesophila]|uniref:Uncharacterized protein n=1 Tax=Allohahella marinimesophila TaxID=1054972 RepID=A0ABP7Q6N0_9GAMM